MAYFSELTVPCEDAVQEAFERTKMKSSDSTAEARGRGGAGARRTSACETSGSERYRVRKGRRRSCWSLMLGGR